MSADSAPPSPAAPVSPATRRRLQQCFAHAQKLSQQEKYDHDYADKLLTDCVVHDPGNLVYVEAFLTNLEKKHNHNKKGSLLKGFGGKGAVKKARAKEDWGEVLAAGPPLLSSNPWDAAVLRPMAEACEALEFYEVELRYLKNALEGNLKDPEVNRHCAKSLTAMAQFDQAMGCWQRVLELRPGDKEAEKMVAELTLERQRARAGLFRGGTSGIKLRPAVVQAALELAAKAAAEKKASPADDEEDDGGEQAPEKPKIELTQRQRLERAIQETPGILDNYLELAELLCEETKYGDAERVLEKSLSAVGRDLKVLARLEEVQIEHARHQLAVAESRAASQPTERMAELVKKLRREVVRREMDVYTARSTRFPQDAALKLEVGLRLKRLGNYAEAISWFDQARADESIKAKALLEAAECLQHLKSFEKALKAYERAAGLAGNDAETKKLALYRAGALSLAMKRPAEAQAHLRRLVKIDAAYRDAAKLLEKIT